MPGKADPDRAQVSAGLGGGLRVSSAALPVGHLHAEGTGPRRAVPPPWRAAGSHAPRAAPDRGGSAGDGVQHPRIARPGAHLVREWNGRTYQVEVHEGGLPDGRSDLAVALGDREAHHGHDMVRSALLRPVGQGRGQVVKKIRCAIYTRKSSEDGLEQEFNSLHAQREACAAYVASQKHEGWVLLPEAYDDGGLSGGSLERPALQRLLDDMRAGRVDQIVVYKIDRLTRSLADFAKIVDVLDAAGASFVSVTQSFNTATSMGRLTLNMLLSFAQFEREVTAERIRDKIAASKRKGLWMGGLVPLGYDPERPHAQDQRDGGGHCPGALRPLRAARHDPRRSRRRPTGSGCAAGSVRTKTARSPAARRSTAATSTTS